MKDDKNKIKEPYDPENTPNPPQDIDPSLRRERGEKEEPIENRKQQNRETGSKQEQKDRPAQKKGAQKKEEKPKLLGESETEINDETTI